jgi:hypothetical protein
MYAARIIFGHPVCCFFKVLDTGFPRDVTHFPRRATQMDTISKSKKRALINFPVKELLNGEDGAYGGWQMEPFGDIATVPWKISA